MIKIHFEKGFVIITNTPPLSPEKSWLIIEDRSMEEIADLLIQYQENRLNLIVYLIHPEPETLLTGSFDHLELIKAAGGIIQNSEKQILFIFRRQHWDLPKGKIEPGESSESACLRELNEECGLQSLELSGYLCTTYHTYRQKDRMILKETIWYTVNLIGNEEPHPQLEEDITKVVWFDKNSLNGILKNTFASIQEVINKYLNHHECQ